MNNTKVGLSIDIQKLKAHKKLTAQKCKVEGCKNAGKWNIKRKGFYLIKGMCNIHYLRYVKYGDINFTLYVVGENRKNNPLYTIWGKIKERCFNKNCKGYKDYGGRGIKMSDEWVNDFNSFCKDMGERPILNLSVERRNNNLGYSKENCYWATIHQQSANKRNNNKNVGVYKVNNRYRSKLAVNGVMVLDENFDTEIEAINARKEAEMRYNISYCLE